MTREETLKILSIVQSAYPAFMNGRDSQVTVNLWMTLFADDSYQDVSNALMGYIANDTKGFAPVVGQIKDQIRKQKQSEDDLTEVAAWALVGKAARNGLYGYKEEFAKLPPVIQRCIGSADVLHDWAMSDESEFETVIASNFQRSYRAQKAVQDSVENLPASIRNGLPSGRTQRIQAPKQVVQYIAQQAQESCKPTKEYYEAMRGAFKSVGIDL